MPRSFRKAVAPSSAPQRIARHEVSVLPHRRVHVTSTPVSGDEEMRAQQESAAQSDRLRAEEIRAQMEADQKLSRLRIQAIRAELQTEALRIWEEVLIRRQKVMADLFDKWWRAMFA